MAKTRKTVVTTRLFSEGDRVVYKNRFHLSGSWAALHNKSGVVVVDQEKVTDQVRVSFDTVGTLTCTPGNLELEPNAAHAPTIHDQAREKFELAMTYGEDGAIASAANILEDLARMYRTRANAIAAQIAAVKDNGGD